MKPGTRKCTIKAQCKKKGYKNMTVMREVDAVSSTLSCFVFFPLVSALLDT
jgi:hypothetical protein